MKKVKLYFKEQVGWMPWANLGAILLVGIITSTIYCRDRSYNRRLKRLEHICRKEIQQLKRRKKERNGDSGEDFELQDLAPTRGRILVSTATEVTKNQETMVMMIIEINKLLRETNVDPEETFVSACQRIEGRVETEEEEQGSRKGEKRKKQERRRR